MTATKQNFEMNEGETKKIVVDQTTDEDTGGDLDITGYQELEWMLKWWRGGETLAKKAESGSSDVTVTDASVGAYEITIQPSDTEGVIADNEETFYHRVRLTDSSGQVSDLLEGEITVDAS